MRIIGIAGLAGSGKDTVAKFIKNELYIEGHYVKILSLADPIKRGCSELFGIDIENFTNRDKKAATNDYWGMTHRKMLQLIGTDCVRDTFDENVWIKRLMKDAYELEFCPDIPEYRELIVIVPDIRFDNEADWIRGNNLNSLLYVNRPDLEQIQENTHKSEAGFQLVEGDHVLMNDKHLVHLYELTKELLPKLIKGDTL